MVKIKALAFFFILSLMGGQAYAYNCSNLVQYTDSTSYATGNEVKNGGRAYRCTVGGWCTTGGPYAPGSGWAWTNAWTDLGACDNASSVSSSVSSARSSSSLSSVPASSRSASSVGGACPGVPVWNSTAAYSGDNLVQRNTTLYRAKWWTQGDYPEESGQWGVWENKGPCVPASSSSVRSSSSSAVFSSSPLSSVASSSRSSTGSGGDKKVVGYFAQWGVYARSYYVKNIHTSGSASKLTHILYAFGNVKNGECQIGDAYADYEMAYTASNSVDGVADTWDAPLRGSFGQLRRLKKMHPHIKVIWSFGGWTWSGGFGEAATNPSRFANSCYNLVKDPRWADVFDGIDIDWEYPNECGLTCDASGFNGYRNLMQALRVRFGNLLVTSAIGAGEAKINAADYAGAAQYVDFYMPMTYDFFGAWAAAGPTAPHSALSNFAGISTSGYYSDRAIQLMKSKGIPANKILLGIGFYGRGWTGVSQATPGGSATGAAQGSYEAGIEDYKVLKNTCPATGVIAGTAYAKCGNNWWSYDTPATISGKMSYVNQQGLGGTFFWELSGDTANGELIQAIKSNL